MPLEQEIEEIRAAIRAGRFANEASVSQGIVLRLLAALSWPVHDVQVVSPEYPLEGRRVDFALRPPGRKPVAFVEVKQVGRSEGAERQLFEYAFHLGVPLAILTDGQEWNFFLPGEQGDYGERRVYKLDIVERDLGECASRLRRYLSFEDVITGKAIEAARSDYRNASNQKLMLATMPGAWSELVGEEDELLLELVADRVESLCGFKPDPDSVAQFLKLNLAACVTGATTPSPGTYRPLAGPEPKVSGEVSQGDFGFTFKGQQYQAKSSRGVLEGVIEALAAADDSFLERFAALPKHGRNRRYLARTPEELYPASPHLAYSHSAKLRSGWFLGTNVSRAAIERILELACDAAGLRFGHDVRVRLGA